MDRAKRGMTPAALGALLAGDVANAKIAMTPGGIEAQEAQGQTDFVSSETLPIEVNYPRGTGRSILESWGIKFGPQQDDLFIKVQLPPGWSKRATDHAMWSDLLDERGRVRAHIFYKAAFYDRSAHISLAHRYTARRDYDAEDTRSVAIAYVQDAGTTIFTSPEISLPAGKRDSAYFEKARVAEDLAIAWLAEHFPDYRNPAAYWETA